MLSPISRVFACGLVLAAFLSACGTQPATLADTQTVQTTESGTKRGNSVLRLGGVASVQKFNLTEKMDINKLQNFAAKKRDAQPSQQQAEDAATVVGLYNTLLSAESAAAKLNLQFSMSDSPVEDGIFLFKVESDQKQQLHFEMYDEEGYQLAAQNQLELEKGANYKALNVRDLANGSYLIKIQNKEGAAFMQKVNIQGK